MRICKQMVSHCATENFYSACELARGLKTYGKAIHRRAAREGWARCRDGNRVLFLPPAGLRRHLLRLVPTEFRRETCSPRELDIRVAQVAEISRAEQRLRALLLFLQFRPAFRIQRALERAARFSTVPCSAASLRRWAERWQRRGFSGLLESRRHHCGVRGKPLHPFAS